MRSAAGWPRACTRATSRCCRASLELAAQGYVTGASGRNWAGYGRHVTLRNVDDTMKSLLTDPQTSGGLLVACERGAVDGVLQLFRAEGFGDAAVIGELAAGSGITVLG